MDSGIWNMGYRIRISVMYHCAVMFIQPTYMTYMTHTTQSSSRPLRETPFRVPYSACRILYCASASSGTPCTP